MGNYREFIKDKKRIVIKIGSSSLMHEQTGRLDLLKIEKLVRILIDIKNSGKDVVLSFFRGNSSRKSCYRT